MNIHIPALPEAPASLPLHTLIIPRAIAEAFARPAYTRVQIAPAAEPEPHRLRTLERRRRRRNRLEARR